MTSFFLIRIVSHSGWTVNVKPNPWPLGWWVGTREDNEWGPSGLPQAVKNVQQATFYPSRASCQKAINRLQPTYSHVGFEVVEFGEV